ncbi:MAG: monovalent cation/H+ antiporter complex subunit F [Acidilobaceae archaeon]
MDLKTLVDLCFTYVVLPIYLVSSSLYIFRIIKGPTVPDMVLALSSFSFNTCFFLVVLALYLGSYYPTVASFFLVLLTFTLDLYVAKYLESVARRRSETS